MTREELQQLIAKIKSNVLVELNTPDNINLSDVQDILKALEDNNSVQKITLGENEIGDAGAAALAQVLRDNRSVQSFVLYSNHIGDAGAAALADALEDNRCVQSFWFNNNHIGDVGATALAEALKVNSNVQSFWLNKNHIGDVGAVALAEAVKVNSSVQSFWLNQNHIGDVGAAALAEALKDNRCVQSFWLYENHIGDAGAAALAEALKVNSSVQSINLDGNHIGDAGAAALADALKDNRNVQSFWLNNNHIGDAGAAALAEIEKELSVNRWIHSLPMSLVCNTIKERCLALKDTCSQLLARYPALVSEPQLVPGKVLDLFRTVDIEITEVAHAIFYANQEDRTKALKELISLLEYQLKPDERHILLELCIQELSGKSSGIKLISYRLLLEAAKKVQSSFPHALQDSQYHPETAGKLMAIPEVMACFVTKASDLESLALLESIVLNQPIVLSEPSAQASTASSLGLFSNSAIETMGGQISCEL